jgi:lysozyme
MKTSPAGRAFITVWEDVRLVSYYCAARVLTIGVGHALTPTERETGIITIDGLGVSWRHGLTREQADLLLTQDLKRFERAVNDLGVNLEQHQFDALISFAFNIGPDAFRDSTLARHVKRKDFVSVPSQLRRWNRAAGRVVEGLKKRREAEAKLFAMGDYAGQP